MTEEYSVAIIQKLQTMFRGAKLHRPMRVARYDAGSKLKYDVQEVAGTKKGHVELVIEKFVGGGFAGQVYRIKVVAIESSYGRLEGLEVGGVYAMKILVPPSGFSRLFRNILYWIGFQGPFQLQVNPTAARAGALWQKFFRRGAKIRFGDQNAVVDIHATFVDPDLGSCGELSEWVDYDPWLLSGPGGILALDRRPLCFERLDATVFRGPLQLPEGRRCKVYDITGRVVAPDRVRPGIYFIVVDGIVTKKVVKVR